MRRRPSLTSTSIISLYADGVYFKTRMGAMKSGLSLIRLSLKKQILNICAICVDTLTSKSFYHNEAYRGINYQDSPAFLFMAFPRSWMRIVIVPSADSFERGLFMMEYLRMCILMIGRGCN